jgi:hypothetical protein
MVRWEMHKANYFNRRTSEGRDHFGSVKVEAGIILNWNVKKHGVNKRYFEL